MPENLSRYHKIQPRLNMEAELLYEKEIENEGNIELYRVASTLLV